MVQKMLHMQGHGVSCLEFCKPYSFFHCSHAAFNVPGRLLLAEESIVVEHMRVCCQPAPKPTSCMNLAFEPLDAVRRPTTSLMDAAKTEARFCCALPTRACGGFGLNPGSRDSGGA